MESENLVSIVYDLLAQLEPILRMTWVTSILIGIAMVVIAFFLKKNPQRKKSPWIVGSIGLVTVISSGSQLLFSLL